jgi:hypothetical protein
MLIYVLFPVIMFRDLKIFSFVVQEHIFHLERQDIVVLFG